MMTDLHSHVLPNIDDGAKNIEESLALIKHMNESGVEQIVCTPHFDVEKNSLKRFLENRNNAFESLTLGSDAPKLILGAEVMYSPALKYKERLHDLCIDGTDYMLMEMPYIRLSKSIINDVANLSDNFGIKLIIAHVERYLNFTDMAQLIELLSLNVYGQINAVSITRHKSKRNCIELIKRGYAQLLGSDLHNFNRGEVCVTECRNHLNKKLGADCFDWLMKNADKILYNKSI